MIHGTKSQPLMLSVCLPEGEINLYPRVKLYDSSDALSATLDFTHVANGKYKVVWTPGTNGYYHGDCIIYTDVGHSIESTDYAYAGVLLKIDEIETNINDIETDTTNIESKVDVVDTVVDAVKIKTDTIDWTDVDFIKEVEGGRWIRDGTQLKFYKDDNITLLATFNLKQADGAAANESDDVYERVRA